MVGAPPGRAWCSRDCYGLRRSAGTHSARRPRAACRSTPSDRSEGDRGRGRCARSGRTQGPPQGVPPPARSMKALAWCASMAVRRTRNSPTSRRSLGRPSAVHRFVGDSPMAPSGRHRPINSCAAPSQKPSHCSGPRARAHFALRRNSVSNDFETPTVNYLLTTFLLVVEDCAGGLIQTASRLALLVLGVPWTKRSG